MSTFRPPQVPQQPAIYYTPGQAAGAVPPVPASQAAAYFRQRPDGPRLQQFSVAAPPTPFVPPVPVQLVATPRRDMTAELEEALPFYTPTQAPGVVPPVAPDQRAAYFRPLPPVLQITYSATPTDTPVVPPPQPPDQRAAYFRPLPPVLQITVNATAGAPQAPQVPPPPLQIPGPPLRSMIIEIEETLPYYTPPPPGPFVPSAPTALPLRSDRSMAIELAHTFQKLTATQAAGAVPAQPPDQRAAYFRRSPDTIQLTIAYVSSPALSFIPAPALQLPDARARPMTAELVALNGFAVSLPTPIVPASLLPVPDPARRSMVAELAAASSFAVSPPAPRFIPAPALQMPQPGARAAAAELAAARGFAISSPPPFVPGTRLQIPDIQRQQLEALQLVLRAGFVPSAVVGIQFYRGETIGLPDDPSRFELTYDNWRITVTFNDYRFTLKAPPLR